MQMKVMVLGNKNTNRRVADALSTNPEIEIICQTDTKEAANVLNREKYDMVLLDGYMRDVENICYRINWICRTPVALIIKGQQTDWNKLNSMDVEGFIPEEASHTEIMAHFQAIARRKKPSIPNVKVLVIEDDLQVQESLKLTFNVYWPEANVCSAYFGEQGIALAKERMVDVILIDIGLPDISGVDVLNKIRSFCKAPVIMMTANRERENIVKTIFGGADDYIVKPFNQEDLMSRVRKSIANTISVN